MILYTFKYSPQSHGKPLQTCLDLLQPDDSVLFLEDGVYALLAHSEWASGVQAKLPFHSMYGLEPDVQARGIENKLISGIPLISYDEFVRLVVKHAQVIGL